MLSLPRELKVPRLALVPRKSNQVLPRNQLVGLGQQVLNQSPHLVSPIPLLLPACAVGLIWLDLVRQRRSQMLRAHPGCGEMSGLC